MSFFGFFLVFFLSSLSSLSLFLLSIFTPHQVVDVRDVDRVLEDVVVLAVHLDGTVDGFPLRVLELGDERDRRALVLGEVRGAWSEFLFVVVFQEGKR